MSEHDLTDSVEAGPPAALDRTSHGADDRRKLTKDHQTGVRCKAMSKQTGKRCGQFCAEGFEVCKWHGGGAPQVKRKAQERLEAMVDEAITDIQSLSKQRAHLPTAFNAARHILDRGIGAVRGTEGPADSRPTVVIGIALGAATGVQVTDAQDIADIEVVDADPLD